MKREIKAGLASTEENKRVKQEETKISINFSKPIGKLTAPSRYQNLTSFDMFKS